MALWGSGVRIPTAPPSEPSLPPPRPCLDFIRRSGATREIRSQSGPLRRMRMLLSAPTSISPALDDTVGRRWVDERKGTQPGMGCFLECAGKISVTALSGGRQRYNLTKILRFPEAVARYACHRSPRHAGSIQRAKANGAAISIRTGMRRERRAPG